METRKLRIRRCSGNSEAWLLAALNADGTECDAYGSYVTAYSIDAVIKRAGYLVEGGATIELVYTPPPVVEPKARNAYGQTFDQWLKKLSAALKRERVSWGSREWQVAAFNTNYLPEVAAYEAACAVNPRRRLHHNPEDFQRAEG